jgi:uncharacterized protein YdeI (BOF family)
MKKITLGLIFTLAATVALAQAPEDLKGPKAKNYKPWKDTTRTNTQVLLATNEEQLQGPEAKNKKVWQNDSTVDKKVVKTGDKKTKPKGPKAKNAKPWKNN